MFIWSIVHQKGLEVLLLLMQTQLLDLINNRLSLLKHLTKPLIRKGRQTHLVPLGEKIESTLHYLCLWQISMLTYWKGS